MQRTSSPHWFLSLLKKKKSRIKNPAPSWDALCCLYQTLCAAPRNERGDHRKRRARMSLWRSKLKYCIGWKSAGCLRQHGGGSRGQVLIHALRDVRTQSSTRIPNGDASAGKDSDGNGVWIRHVKRQQAASQPRICSSSASLSWSNILIFPHSIHFVWVHINQNWLPCYYGAESSLLFFFLFYTAMSAVPLEVKLCGFVDT